MNTLKNIVSTTVVPRTGTLVITQVIDLDALAKEHEDGQVALDVLADAGQFVITIGRSGKVVELARVSDRVYAYGFAGGFLACAEYRARPKAKRGAK